MIAFSQSEKIDYSAKYYNLLTISKTHQPLKNNFKLIKLYKYFISSQDNEDCPYSPSCSEYAAISVKKNVFIGILKSFDRLSRCNRSQSNYYKKTKENKLIDNP
jgi:putative component of membrane protein insertase Oxa1/YidC/SpoIIIJ protein YidD